MIKKFTSWNDFPGCNINSNSINDRIFRRRKASIKEISGSVDSVIMLPFQLLRIIKLLRLSWINLCLSNIKANCIKDRSVVFKILFDVRKKWSYSEVNSEPNQTSMIEPFQPLDIITKSSTYTFFAWTKFVIKTRLKFLKKETSSKYNILRLGSSKAKNKRTMIYISLKKLFTK